jgi:predicted nucleic acid-binding protein
MASVLVDTNILLISIQPENQQYPLASSAVAELLRQGADLCVAPQSLVEFWVVATRPTASNGLGMSPAAVVAEIQRVRKVFHVLEGAPEMSETWERLVSKHFVLGKQAHDANLVATMLVHGVKQRLTFNGADFKRYDGVEVIEPAKVAQ